MAISLGQSIQCHKDCKRVDPGNSMDKEKRHGLTAYCAGSMIFRNNILNDPRDPRISAAQELYGKSRRVFGTLDEFYSYHIRRAHYD